MFPDQQHCAIASQKPKVAKQVFEWLRAIPLLALSFINAFPAGAQNRILLRQFPESSAGRIIPQQIRVDRDRNLYLTGQLFSMMVRETPIGSLFVAKYDRKGSQIWQHNSLGGELLGSSASALDKSGNLYFTGYHTFNAIVPGVGTVYQFWIAKYNSAGELIWQETVNSQDSIKEIAVDQDENFYLVGTTIKDEKLNQWLAKYNRDHQLQWRQELTELDSSFISTMTIDDNNNIYLAGNQTINLDGTNAGKQDTWIAKYDSNGNRLWAQQLGSEKNDSVSAITTDSTGNIYLTGYTYGDLGGTNAGQEDVWVAKYNQDGTRLWTQLFGSDRRELSTAIQVDAAGNSYITGYRSGDLGENRNLDFDGWIISYDPDGNLQWSDRIATPEYDQANTLTIDAAGDIYVAGFSGNSGWIIQYLNPN